MPDINVMQKNATAFVRGYLASFDEYFCQTLDADDRRTVMSEVVTAALGEAAWMETADVPEMFIKGALFIPSIGG
jgi:hypothetical protein